MTRNVWDVASVKNSRNELDWKGNTWAGARKFNGTSFLKIIQKLRLSQLEHTFRHEEITKNTGGYETGKDRKRKAKNNLSKASMQNCISADLFGDKECGKG